MVWEAELPLITGVVSRETFAAVAGELLQQAILWKQQSVWRRERHGVLLPVTHALVTRADALLR